MERNEFLQAVQKGRLSGVYLFEGEDEALKSDALRRVRRQLLTEGLEEMNETVLTNPETPRLMEMAETLPFMADKRLIIVRDQDGLTGRTEGDDALCEYLVHVPTSTVLIYYVIGSANKSKKLAKAIKKCGEIIEFKRMKGDELTNYVIDRFKQLDCACGRREAEQLIFTAGQDSGVLGQEIGKLAAAAGAQVTPEIIDRLATRSLECTVFQMTDAVLAGNRRLTFRRLDDLLKNGEERLGILAMLLRQYRQLQHVKIMRFEKLAPEEIASRLGVKGYALNRLLQQAERIGGRQVKQAVEICVETELKVKSGAINQEGSLETALLRIFELMNP